MSDGVVTLDGQRIDRWPAARRTRQGLARSFQSLELFHDMSIRDNLRTASDSKSVMPYLTDLIYPRDVPLSSAAIAAVHDFGLEQYLDQADDLSTVGGGWSDCSRARHTAVSFDAR